MAITKAGNQVEKREKLDVIGLNGKEPDD